MIGFGFVVIVVITFGSRGLFSFGWWLLLLHSGRFWAVAGCWLRYSSDGLLLVWVWCFGFWVGFVLCFSVGYLLRFGVQLF